MAKAIDRIRQAADEKKTLFSFEYFPPKTPQGVQNLFDRLDRMGLAEPAWIDVTWGAGGSTSDLTYEICETANNFMGLTTMMHLTCTNMPKELIKQTLDKLKEAGIRNVLALRGDPPRGEEWKQIEGGFAHATDLVKYMRENYGDYFCICVAGYPEGHVDCANYEEDLKHLKEKVDAGADLIITQLFYDVDLYVKYVNDCRAIGVNVPIVPGIMPIHTYAGFTRMTTLCKTFVPPFILEALEPIKHDDEAVKEYGIKLCIDMCQKLVAAGAVDLHFYTLNLEKSVLRILEGLKLVSAEKLLRPLPWRSPKTNTKRVKEEVRPIFWANRPHSYMSRTESWDDFPNGRWGDSRSPAFGSLVDYHLMSLHTIKSFDKLNAWGTPLKVEDVHQVFAKYCRGEIPILPWIDSPLASETEVIRDTLIRLNVNGFLTINSQPRVNAAHSNDPKFGWGGPNGYVFQKAYVEFFTSPENLSKLLNMIPQFPSLTFHAINSKGEAHTNTASTTAVTWGVFPGKEIIQPTVVDSHAFEIWKDEAFGLWRSQWALLYPEGAPSRKLIEHVHDTYWLVNIVDNNFVDGDIFAIFNKLIENIDATQ